MIRSYQRIAFRSVAALQPIPGYCKGIRCIATAGPTVHNSLTGSVQELQPPASGPLKWYACGPTVYDVAHVGHARTYVSVDIIRRILLNYFGLEIFFLMGVTDVDDKIIQRAGERKEEPLELAQRFEASFFNDMDDLGVMRPTAICRVSEHIGDIISFISKLVEQGNAYTTPAGVYFSTESLGQAYGKMQPSAHHGEGDGGHEEDIVGREGKRNPKDFVLWKLPTPHSSAMSLSWDSPWGKGRPGWHIECSSFIEKVFGHHLHIHSGGIDLKFPHHCNEVAQCEAFNGKEGWCDIFIHTGHLYIQGRKMSKSLKNFIAVEELLQDYHSDTFRMFCLKAHYGANVTFSKDIMEEANAYLSKFVSVCKLSEFHFPSAGPAVWCEEDEDLLQRIAATRRGVLAALANNFNTPEAIHHLYDLARHVDSYHTRATANKRSDLSLGPLHDAVHLIRTTLTNFGISSLQGVGDSSTNDIRGLEELSRFRASVREKALQMIRSKQLDKQALQSILQECDRVRDEVLNAAGVAVKDHSSK